MADWRDEPWAWESDDEYERNQNNIFRRWARTYGYQPVNPADYALRTIMGEPQQQQQVQQAMPKEEKGGGGILGALGKVGETVSRPFEWEQEHIGKPISKGMDIVASALATPLRMATRGETPEEAWKEATSYERPAWSRELGQQTFSPSMWLGLGGAGKTLQAIKAARGAKTATTGGLLSAETLKQAEVSGKALRRAVMPKAAKEALEEAKRLGLADDMAEQYAAMKIVAGSSAEGATEELTTRLGNLIKHIDEMAQPHAKALKAHHKQTEAATKAVWKRWHEGKITYEAAQAQSNALRRGKVMFPELEDALRQFTKEDLAALKYHAGKRAGQLGYTGHEQTNLSNILSKALEEGQSLARWEREYLSEIFGAEFAKLVAERPTTWGIIGDIIGLPRTVQASMDISFPLRQGVMVAPRHPLIWANETLIKGVRAFLNEGYANDVNAVYRRLQKAGKLSKTLDIVEYGVGAPVSRRAEGFLVRYLSKMGPAKVLLDPIRRSERAFATAGNATRVGIERHYVQRLSGNGLKEIATRDMDDIGRIANYLTGRGPVPKDWVYPLSQILYSPRFVTSGPAFMAKMLDPRLNNHARQIMAEELVAFVGAGTGILGALGAAGLASQAEISPLSSDFGKIKVGKMRFDMWGGKQQIARYIAQFSMGQRKTIGTGEMMDAARNEVALRFGLSKLSPQAGFIADLLRGETYMGEEVSAKPGTMRTMAWNRMAPLAIQDITEALKEEQARGAAGAVSLLGVGVLTFETPGQKVARIAEEKFGVDWNKTNYVDRLRMEDQSPELKAARQEQLQAAEKWGQSGGLELRAKDAEFEQSFKEMLSRPDVQGSALVGAFRNYIEERQVASGIYYRDNPDMDPRDELEQKLDELYSIPYPEFGTPEQRDAWYDFWADALDSDPRLLPAMRDNQMLRFTDPQVRQWIAKYHDAQQIWREYRRIPHFVGVGLDEGREAQRLVTEARAYVEYGVTPDTKAALNMIRRQHPEIPTRIFLIAMNAERLRNPQRRQFKLANADTLLMFESVDVDELTNLI